jgi:hypothetical protein
VARLGQRRRGPARLHPQADRAPPRPSCLPPPAVVPGAPAARCGRERHRLVLARGQGDGGAGLAGQLRQIDRRVPQRLRAAPFAGARRAYPRRQLFRRAQLLLGADRVRPAGRAFRCDLGVRARHRTGQGALPAGSLEIAAEGSLPVEARSVVVLTRP